MTRPRHRLRTVAAAVTCALALALTTLAATPAGAATAGNQPVCPAVTPNQHYVNFVYEMILMRCPDAAGGLYWAQQLDGGLDRWVFAEAIDMSDENVVRNNVVDIFHGLLDRDPTAAEVDQWSASIREHHGDALMIATLGSSDEFYGNLPGTTTAEKDDAWLTSAYNGILDRDPDAGGRDYYLAQLGDPSTAATRFDVAIQLELSLENAQDWTEAVYYAGLNRPPDDAGFAYWLNWLTGPGNWQTFRMWTHILASDEAYALAQQAPTGIPAPKAFHDFG